MIPNAANYSKFSNVKKFRFKFLLYIAVFWTIIDIIVTTIQERIPAYHPIQAMFLREIILFSMSLYMGWLFIFKLRRLFRHSPIWVNFVLKSFILLLAAFLMNFIINYMDALIRIGDNYQAAWERLASEAFQANWLLRRMLYWMILFVVTQLILMINEKYSPGVFKEIIFGTYTEPKIETRIVMFMDLKDSTPIAEKLGHHLYFKFIRDFIYQVSMAIIEYGGRIYQYVGDEVVASWKSDPKNYRKCMAAVIEARKNLQKHGEEFRRKYGFVPEFRVGIHVGEVTIGEIGVIKKDIAMSGDTMNTTARIRSAANELNHKFIVSKDFIDAADLKDWQSESLGIVDLKGKHNGLELFSLKI